MFFVLLTDERPEVLISSRDLCYEEAYHKLQVQNVGIESNLFEWMSVL